MTGLQGAEQLVVSDHRSCTWDEFCTLLDHPLPDVPGADLAAGIPDWFKFPNRLFFEAHPQKRALEVLCVKLALLREVCVLVADEHERVGRARGVINPEDVVVSFHDHRGTMVPSCWSATVSLKPNGQENQLLTEGMPPEMAADFRAVPTMMNPVFASPLVKDWPLGKTLPVTVLIQSMDVLPTEDESAVRGAIQAHVIAEGLQAKDFSDQDLFRLSFPIPIGGRRGAHVDLWARKVASPERGIVISGTSSRLAHDIWSHLSATQAEVRSSAELVVYRAATPAHDVYSCGMLVLQALLGSHTQPWGQAYELIPSVGERLQPVVQGLAADDFYSLVIGVRDRIRDSTGWSAGEHIPELLWWDAVVAVLRACSRLQGFSYAGAGGTDERSPARLLALELRSLTRRARAELFEAEERDALMARVCEHVSAQLRVGTC